MSDKIKFLDQLVLVKNTAATSNRAFFDVNDLGELEIAGLPSASNPGTRIMDRISIDSGVNGDSYFEANPVAPAPGALLTGPNPTTPFDPPGGGTFPPNTVVSGTLQVTGDIIAGGTIGAIDRDDLRVTDNKILLNVGETGPGVTAGQAGIIVIRDDPLGTAPHSALVWDESILGWDLNFGIPQNIEVVPPETPGAGVPLPDNPVIKNVGVPTGTVGYPLDTDITLAANVEYVQDYVTNITADDVVSVFGRIGAVVAEVGDYAAFYLQPSDSVGDLSDVDLTGIVDTNILAWNATNMRFEPSTVQSSFSILLDQLDDVTITAPSDYESLIYFSGGWINGYGNRIQDDDADTFVTTSVVDDEVHLTAGPDGGNIILTVGTPAAEVRIENGSPTDPGIIDAPNGLAVTASAGDVTIQGLQWPAADGTIGQVMTTDGVGVLSFTDGLTPFSVVDLIYPIGSVIYSANNVNPGVRFTGTTWVAQATGRFIAGVGSFTDGNADNQTFAAGTVAGGEYNHTLTIPEMPAHGHDEEYWRSNGSIAGNPLPGRATDNDSASTNTSDDTGGDGPHNNIPPGYALYVWERTV